MRKRTKVKLGPFGAHNIKVMKRTSLVEIVNEVINTLNIDQIGYVANQFKAIAGNDGSEIQSLCFQFNTDDQDSDEEEVDNIKASMKNYIVNEVERTTAGQLFIKNEMGNGCTVYTLEDCGFSLNWYDTDYGFWVTLVYNLD